MNVQNTYLGQRERENQEKVSASRIITTLNTPISEGGTNSSPTHNLVMSQKLLRAKVAT
jgi:hypothetical protein